MITSCNTLVSNHPNRGKTYLSVVTVAALLQIPHFRDLYYCNNDICTGHSCITATMAASCYTLMHALMQRLDIIIDLNLQT